MTSYKAKWIESEKKLKEQKDSLNTVSKTVFLCPLCNSIILESNSEYFCKNEKCKFDKTINDLWFYYTESNKIERLD